MSAFSIKRTLDLTVFERLLSSESGHSAEYIVTLLTKHI